MRTKLMGSLFISAAALWLAASAPAEEAGRRWEAAIQRFEAMDKNAPPPERPLLFTGSSSIRLWDVETAFAEYGALNRGFGGSVYDDLNHFFDRVVRVYRPRAIVVYSGDNDAALGADAEAIHAAFTEFADRVARELPDTPVIVLAIKPSIARWELWPIMAEANARMAAHAEAHGHVRFVDTAAPLFDADGEPDPAYLRSDRLHLNEAGYARWREILAPVLAETLGADDADGD